MKSHSDKEFKINRKIILIRDRHKCRYCSSKENLVVHHLRPLNRGGNHELYNLITLCSKCHAFDHQLIKEHGLATIPGPDFEDLRDYLTDKDDVDRYREYLQSIGIEAYF
jgi:HNH endonuclease